MRLSRARPVRQVSKARAANRMREMQFPALRGLSFEKEDAGIVTAQSDVGMYQQLGRDRLSQDVTILKVNGVYRRLLLQPPVDKPESD